MVDTLSFCVYTLRMKLKYFMIVALAASTSGCVVLDDPHRYGRTSYDVCVPCGDEPVWINRDYVGEQGDLTNVYPR